MFGVRCSQSGDVPDNDDVVAGVVFGMDRAVQPGQGAVEDGVAPSGRVPGDAGPFVGAPAGELAGDSALTCREDVDGEGAGIADAGVGGAGLHDTEGDEWRIDGDAVERLAGEADWALGVVAGDDGDSGGVVTDGVAELSFVEGIC